MRNAMAFFGFAFVAACNSCAPQPAPAPPPPIVVVDAGPIVFDAAPPPAPVIGDACGTAEAHATAIGCALVATVKGADWATVCRAYQANGINMHTACVSDAADCNAVTACLSR